MTYEELLKEAEENNLIVKEKPLKGYEGRIKGNKIAIKKDMTEVEKTCALIEEISHFYNNTGNIIDLSDVKDKRQELQARKWAYEKLVPLKSIIQASFAGCIDLFELSEYLDVTESFLKEALIFYQGKYGLYKEVDEYCIYFSPLTVCKYKYE